MANLGAQVIIDGAVAHQTEEQYAQLEVELQTMSQQNEGLTREL